MVNGTKILFRKNLVDMIIYLKYSLSQKYFFFEIKLALHIFMSTQNQMIFFLFLSLKN